MGVTDYGAQTQTFDYKNPLTGESFNKLLNTVLPTGLYTETILSKVSDSSITIPADISYVIKASNEDLSVKTSNADPITLTGVSSVNKYIVIRFQWFDVENNYADFLAVDTLLPDDILIGEAIYSGPTLTSFDYDEQTNGIIALNKDLNTVIRKTSLVTRPQSVLLGDIVEGSTESKYLLLTGPANKDQVNLKTDTILTIADGYDDDIIELNWKVKIDSLTTPSEWLFTGGDAAGRYQVYMEIDTSNVNSVVISYGKINDVTNSFTNYSTTAPIGPSTGDMYYNPLHRKMYEWSGSAWIQVKRIMLGSVDWSGVTLTDIFAYDFKATTKIDYTKYIGGSEYKFLPDSRPYYIIPDDTTNSYTFVELPLSTNAIDWYFALEDADSAVQLNLKEDSGDTNEQVFQVRFEDVGTNRLYGTQTIQTKNNTIYQSDSRCGAKNDSWIMTFKCEE